MRVLVTGAGGNLGRAVVPALVAAGHTPRLFDFRPLETDHEVMVGDIRDRNVVAKAVDGVDAVVHGAALHGVHLQDWSAEDFWAINADGTFNVYRAAQEVGVRRCVLSSSMAVYGDISGPQGHWTVVTEESATRPTEVYGLTKVVSEEIARFYADRHGVTTVAVRLGMFVPETFERYGFRLLFGGVDDRDVAQAVLLALTRDLAEPFTAVNIFAESGFTADDVPRLNADLAATLDEKWPGTTDLVEERGLSLDDLVWGRLITPVDKARHELGYQPRHNFAEFLAAFRRGDREYYPESEKDWWGTQRPQ